MKQKHCCFVDFFFSGKSVFSNLQNVYHICLCNLEVDLAQVLVDPFRYLKRNGSSKWLKWLGGHQGEKGWKPHGWVGLDFNLCGEQFPVPVLLEQMIQQWIIVDHLCQEHWDWSYGEGTACEDCREGISRVLRFFPWYHVLSRHTGISGVQLEESHLRRLLI